MKNERTLAYKMSQKICKEDLQDVSAAGGWTNSLTANATYNGGVWDAAVDVNWDL